MTRGTTRHIVRAALEVSLPDLYVLQICKDALQMPCSGDGGGHANDLLMQFKAIYCARRVSPLCTDPAMARLHGGIARLYAALRKSPTSGGWIANSPRHADRRRRRSCTDGARVVAHWLGTPYYST